jgi:anaerobic selenocysteine-containing dehydrogenase
MRIDEPTLYESDEAVARASLRWDDPTLSGMSWEKLAAAGWAKLQLPDAPFAEGGFQTPTGKCEFASTLLAGLGADPLPDYLPPYESPDGSPELAARYPLAMISPPARHFLNSSFVNVESLRATESEPHLDIHPADAAPRGIREGDYVRVHNDRGSLTARARLTERAREGVVVGLSIWWKKLSPDGRNANQVTSQALTDLGGSATFYDCLVEVERV